MRLSLSEHAKVRQRQLGCSNLSLQILKQFGRTKIAKGGIIQLFFGNKEATQAAREFKKMVQVLDKTSCSCLIIKNGQVSTIRRIKG